MRLIDNRPRQHPVLLELARCRRLRRRAVISWGWRRHHGNGEVVARFKLAGEAQAATSRVFASYVAAARLRQGPLCMMVDEWTVPELDGFMQLAGGFCGRARWIASRYWMASQTSKTGSAAHPKIERSTKKNNTANLGRGSKSKQAEQSSVKQGTA